jgi:hypothetical protein
VWHGFVAANDETPRVRSRSPCVMHGGDSCSYPRGER